MTNEQTDELIQKMSRISLLIGSLIGSISAILNEMEDPNYEKKKLYNQLKDAHQAAGLQIHEIYYKDVTRD